LYVPQNGSGTLSFWETTVGVSSVQPCWHQYIVSGPAAGIQVEEHDGSALASDPNGIAPISIAKWIGMSTFTITPDVRHGDVLQAMTNAAGTTVVQPINGSGQMNVTGCTTTGSASACFPITREIFNVLDYFEVTNVAPPSGAINNVPYSAVLAGLFSGSASSLCKSAFTITNLGFGQLPTANSLFNDQCGSTASTLRVQMNATSTQG